MSLKLDHFAFGADNLEQGVEVMSERLGAGPCVCAKHALFGTHNALWRLETADAPVYLELIAIDPAAPKAQRNRWFGLDDANVQARFAGGPKLLTFVAATDDFHSARRGMPIDPGEAVAVSRNNLSWLFSLHEDGRLVDDGALPYLIEWAPGPTPVQAMNVQNIQLLRVSGRRLAALDMVWSCETAPSDACLELTLQNAQGKTVRFST